MSQQSGPEIFKARQRATWEVGDYPDIATTIAGAAADLVASAQLQPGERVLDVACGSGNVAVPAAQTGATVVGLDLTPRLLEAARSRAAETGVEIEFIEGDAEALPFAEGSFDAVLSSFGCMFAPRHAVTAGELVRVCRPGGRIGVNAWTPESTVGDMFRTLGAKMPPIPEGVEIPLMWGNEEHVRGLLEPLGVAVTIERRTVVFERESPEAFVAHYERVFGPMIVAKATLEPQGLWEETHAEFLAMARRQNLAQDGTMRAEAEYLYVSGVRPGGL